MILHVEHIYICAKALLLLRVHLFPTQVRIDEITAASNES